MTKLIWGVISSFLLIFVVWLALSYSIYGNDFINHNIDLVSTLNKMFNVPQPDTNQFSTMFQNFRDTFSRVGDFTESILEFTEGDWGVFEWVKMIFTGLEYIARLFYYLYNIVNFGITLISILVNYVKYACDLLVNVIITLFNPTFI